MRTLRATCAAAAAVGLCGCSFLAVRGPPRAPQPGAPLECTESRAAPGLDTAGAILAPLVGVTAWGICEGTQATQSWGSDPQDLRCGNVGWATLAVTAAYTAAAVYGFHETGECRRLAAQGPPPDAAAWPARPLPESLAPRPPR